MLCERKMNDLLGVSQELSLHCVIWCASGVVITLCFVGYKKKIVCIVMSLNIILFDWTISEHWTKASAK